MKKEFKIEFIEDIQEFTNEEMGAIIGGSASTSNCNCQCIINFKGDLCNCNAATPKATFDSCPCECQTN